MICIENLKPARGRLHRDRPQPRQLDQQLDDEGDGQGHVLVAAPGRAERHLLLRRGVYQGLISLMFCLQNI